MSDFDAYIESLPEPVLSTGETRLEVQRHLPLVCAADEGFETYEVEVEVKDSQVASSTWLGAPFELRPDEELQAVRQVEECYDESEHYIDPDEADRLVERTIERMEAAWRPD